MNEENILKTGTTTVGIVCNDGLVLAADKRATAGHMIVNKKADKLHKLNENIAVTIAGSVSDVQVLLKYIKAEINLKRFRTKAEVTVKDAANLLSNMVYSNIRKYSMIPGVSHFIMGGRDSESYSMYDLFPDGSLTEVDDYISSGSGSVFALGLLENAYKQGLSVEEGVELARKAVNVALQRDSASGNGIDVITITKDGVIKI
ncbi:proteasome subunit beta [Candidatus Woesearchaeota archaeon]|nr:proteasome subunit beta [Candidatus Woesearchaeota archaeon]